MTAAAFPALRTPREAVSIIEVAGGHPPVRKRVDPRRDRLGVKPLVGDLVFASELKAVLLSGIVRSSWTPRRSTSVTAAAEAS